MSKRKPEDDNEKGIDFLDQLTESLGKQRVLDIFMTSCDGQAITHKTIHDTLHKGSTFVTLAEYHFRGYNKAFIQDKTLVINIRHLAEILNKATFSDMEVRPITSDRLLTDYLMHWKSAVAAPTWTRIEYVQTMSALDWKSPYLCIKKLNDTQKNSLLNKICDFSNDGCRILLNGTIKDWQDSKIDMGSEKYMKPLRKNKEGEKLGVIWAIKLNYALYCNELNNTHTQTPEGKGIFNALKAFLGYKKEKVEKVIPSYCCNDDIQEILDTSIGTNNTHDEL